MNVAVTGGSGLIGKRLLAALKDRGDEVIVLSRDPGRAQAELGVPAAEWQPLDGPAPAATLAGVDAVVHLAGAPVAQRWTDAAKRAIRDSRLIGTSNLVAGLRASAASGGGPDAAPTRARVLVCASAVGYYGSRGDEPLDEDASPGTDFLAHVCVTWEHEAASAEAIGVRVASLRTGVVLDRAGGALAKMLPPFRAGVGGPVAGGRQYIPWIHLDDLVGMYLAAVDDERWRGAINACAPVPVTNREFSKTLGRVLGRPAVMPVPAIALKLMYGAMAEVVTGGQRALPVRAQALGYSWKFDELEPALRAALA